MEHILFSIFVYNLCPLTERLIVNTEAIEHYREFHTVLRIHQHEFKRAPALLLMPPSTGRLMPVIHAASSEARNKAA
jgi:hypothetical protein